MRAMEISALGTYAFGRKATPEEIKGKGESRTKAIADLKQLAALGKGEALPAGLQSFDPNSEGHDPRHMAQYGRAVGRVAAGDEEELSDLEQSSADEYSDDEIEDEADIDVEPEPEPEPDPTPTPSWCEVQSPRRPRT